MGSEMCIRDRTFSCHVAIFMLAIVNSGLDSWRGALIIVGVISLPSEPHFFGFDEKRFSRLFAD